MANADFWRDLAAQFRALPNDDGLFRIEWCTIEGTPEIKWKWSATDDTRVAFETLARRAGFAVNPEAPDFLLTWISLLRDSSGSSSIRTAVVIKIGSEESHYRISGAITDPCGTSALQCSVLEADAQKKKRGTILYAPNDTRTLLSSDALKRVERAYIEAERFIWEAEAAIDSQGPLCSEAATNARNQGRMKKAQFVLRAVRAEYSRLGLSDSEYRLCINGEIESAVNSLDLYKSQRNLLETELFFQVESEPTTPGSTFSSSTPTTFAERAACNARLHTIGDMINRLREECGLSIEELGEKVGIDPTNVSRHLRGHSKPTPRNRRKYERVFSNLLNRQILLSKTQLERS